MPENQATSLDSVRKVLPYVPHGTHPEKTRLLRFRWFAVEDRKKRGEGNRLPRVNAFL